MYSTGHLLLDDSQASQSQHTKNKLPFSAISATPPVFQDSMSSLIIIQLAQVRNFNINFDKTFDLSACNHHSLCPVNFVSQVILKLLLGVPLSQLLISVCTYSDDRLMIAHCFVESFQPLSKTLTQKVISLFKAFLQEYILLGSHSHLSLDSTLELTFQNIFRWFIYMHDYNYSLSACYSTAYLPSCKYIFCGLYRTEWLRMGVLELVYLASNPGSAIYQQCDLTQGI